jgi:predicted nucleic acid-binding protein
VTGLIDVLVDTSIVVKWFHDVDEPDVEAARGLLEAQASGDAALFVLDLTHYELGNVLMRSLKWSAARTASLLANLAQICPSEAPSLTDFTEAAGLAETYNLTFYDAAYAAVAAARGAAVATADTRLLTTGLGQSPQDVLAGIAARN